MSVRRSGPIALAALALLFHALACAGVPGSDPRAFLDRDQVSLGDTATLNLQSAHPFATPDLAPLQKDFRILGTSRSTSTQVENGKTTSHYQVGIALMPRHSGSLAIPSFDVAGTQTAPLTLHVGAAPSGGRGKLGDPVFMEAGVRSSSPYVGEQTLYTVRLFYEPGVDGALGDPTAAGARLIPLDRDRRYTAKRDGYAYKVVERSWALIPGHSGAITVDGPDFQGQQMAPARPGGWLNNPNALLNAPSLRGFGAPVRATAPSVTIEARKPPAGAGKPWLPARKVSLELRGLPADGDVDAGTPLTLTLVVAATGLPADALPAPELPSIPGARVYPDQIRDSDADHGDWLRGNRTRSFAIVPEHNGPLRIPAITLDWWNVVDDRAEQARLPPHALEVTGVASPSRSAATPAPDASAPAPATASAGRAVASGSTGDSAQWRKLALAGLGLWLVTLAAGAAVWWRYRRRSRTGDTPHAAADPIEHGADASVAEAAIHGVSGAGERTTVVPPRILQRRALDAAREGDAAGCERALLAWARGISPGVTSLGGLRERLADPAQADALEALELARWRGGGAAAACAKVADAFARGFRWRDPRGPSQSPGSRLPPLYPT